MKQQAVPWELCDVNCIFLLTHLSEGTAPRKPSSRDELHAGTLSQCVTSGRLRDEAEYPSAGHDLSGSSALAQKKELDSKNSLE